MIFIGVDGKYNEKHSSVPPIIEHHFLVLGKVPCLLEEGE